MNSYNYSLHASGHRTQVQEASGRTVGYTLDNLYRLTSETTTGDGNPVLNGSSDWTYDRVGNRLSQQTDIGDLLDQAETYSANNWLDRHTYDDNGNTTESFITHSPSVILNDHYDWRNRLIRRERSDGTIIEIVYDGFGDRIKKTISGLSSPPSSFQTTWYQVDRNNLTGYAQVVEEVGQGDVIEVIYTYGLDLISQDRRDADGSGNFTQSFYLYDGLGSVRGLTDASEAVTDEYVYDAWGVLLESTGSTENSFQFAGEQWDADLEMYFLRARYMNTSTGRFHTMDTFEGVASDPVTLHKYLYANAAPNMWTDPSGNVALAELTLAQVVRTMLLPSLTSATFTGRLIVGALVGTALQFYFTNHYFPNILASLVELSSVPSLSFKDRLAVDLLYNKTVDAYASQTRSNMLKPIKSQLGLGIFSILTVKAGKDAVEYVSGLNSAINFFVPGGNACKQVDIELAAYNYVLRKAQPERLFYGAAAYKRAEAKGDRNGMFRAELEIRHETGKYCEQ